MQKLDSIKILNKFSSILRENYNVGNLAFDYIEGLIRPLLKDKEQYLKGRKAFISFIRSYARLPMKDIFVAKKLNLHLLAKSFGLNSVYSKDIDTKDERY